MTRQILTILIVAVFVAVGCSLVAYHAGEVHEAQCVEQLSC